ncbi:acetyltransferase (GNAT) family protein [Hoeflea sp. IMCC20628]|uniref:GNAT family N-acetyltransferase n=1 Tax=Hoeflea sp. IMCC20628 TaxID=1620421 RepID=UPI00063BDD0F|nr:GNAT family N-acetyltransferase [Hoeflea sp. IMCC20628]AKI03266.1 acetyltransferase (GNAT) family protein [Hoeflea sp. IMCC20628]
MPNLAIVRRLEAVGFRAWPAASIQYDGSWQIRLTAGHPSKRLNSVNPLDPSDHDGIEIRVERAARRFDSYDRALVFRQTPLAPPPLESYLDKLGWRRFDETIVMMSAINSLDIDSGMDHLPLRDVGRYVDASIAVHGRDQSLKPGLTEVLSSIRPPSGLFVLEGETTGPLSTALCVHDNDLAGLFELATRKDTRRAGHGREIVIAALRWARHRGAETAWLQVESANTAAVALYKGLGFGEVYRYAYRQRPGY